MARPRRAAGYSGTPLIAKLGIKPGMRAALFSTPAGFAQHLGPLPDGVKLATSRSTGFDFILVFSTSRAELTRRVPALAARLVSNGMLWVAWPKGTSGVQTDLNENVVREVALGAGLVDVKVCAIDETWSGLKLVYRLADRARRAPSR